LARASRKIRIRTLRISDYEAVIELLAATKMNPHVRGRESRAAFRRQLLAHPTTYLGAFDGDRLAACVFGTHDTRKAWINRLAVHAEHRRQGLASRLVLECERRLRRQGMEMFVALIDGKNRGSTALFRSLGYNVVGLNYAWKKRRPDV